MWDEIISGPKQLGLAPDEVIAFRESKEGKALQGWIQQKFQAAQDARQKEERQWNYNLAMYNGNQWVMPTVVRSDSGFGSSGALGVPRSGQNRTRLTVNRIKPVVRTEVSKFIAQKPGASVIPATDEDDDILAAEAGEAAWESCITRAKVDMHYRNAIWWMCITGNGFIKNTWDPSAFDPDSELDGDISYGSVRPYELFFADLEVKDLQDQPFVIHAYARSTEQLKIKYEEVLPKGLNPSCKKSTIEEASYAAPMKQDVKTYDSNMLIEFWVKPGFCSYLKDGGVITLIDDVIVEVINDGLPYEHGEYPFVQFAHIESERFYRTSIIPDLIDLQKDYNSLRSQIAESRKKMGKPQILAPKGSISASKMTTEIGLVIEYKYGMQPPQPMPIQNLPAYILQEVDMLKADIEDLSGQHEVSKGQTPTGVTAATAISYLQESDDSYQLPSFKNVEEAWGRLAKQSLMLMVQYWDVQRVVKVVGKEDAFSIQLLSGADLKRATDVRIEPGSSLPQSKAAKQAFIMDLMMNQFIPPDEGLEMLEIGAAKKLMDMLKNDKRQAQRENIKFKRLTPDDLMAYEQEYAMALQQQGIDPQGIDPTTGEQLQAPLIIPVHTYDNHEVHIEEHDRFRKGQEFETLPAEIQQLVESHVMQHKTMMQQVMLQQTMSQIPTDGTINDGVDGTVGGEADPTAGPSDPSQAPDTGAQSEVIPEGVA
jgi:hypothetical protein